MGDRGQVELVSAEGSVFLYTHWGADYLPMTVANALGRGKGRWGDDEYLNRIIFSEMIFGEVMGETGYGIGLSEHDDVWRIVVVNHVDRTVVIKEVDYSDISIEHYQETIKWTATDPVTFDEFISLFKGV